MYGLDSRSRNSAIAFAMSFFHPNTALRLGAARPFGCPDHFRR
jgi:hypothetical protein